MLPLSIIEKPAFKKFMEVFDPSFVVPGVKCVKNTHVITLKERVTEKIMIILKTIPYPNVSVDGWCDAVMRCFNGYIVQGIDMEWNLHTIPIAFEHVTGYCLKFIKQYKMLILLMQFFILIKVLILVKR